MERHEVLAMMTALKLAGMRAAYDDILADGLKRRHPVQQIIGTLLQTEVADKQARSIKYQMASACLSSTWSTTSRPSSAPDARAAPQTSSSAATSSSSTNSATCPSPRPAGSCSST